MTFTEVMEHVAQAFEVLGTFVLAAGTLCSFVLAGLTLRRSGSPRQAYAVIRQFLGGTLLLGLEILVAADLVRTIAVAPTLDNVLNRRTHSSDQDLPELLHRNRDYRGAAVAPWAGKRRRRDV